MRQKNKHLVKIFTLIVLLFSHSEQVLGACPDLYEEKATCISKCNDIYEPLSNPSAFCQWGCYRFHDFADLEFEELCKLNPNPSKGEILQFLENILPDCYEGIAIHEDDRRYLETGCSWEKGLIDAHYRFPVP